MASALVLIDLMPRIVALPLAPHSGEDVLSRCRALAAAFRERDRPVVLVRVERPGVAEQPPGSDLVPGLAEPGDIVVVKRAISAFHETDLHERLQRLGVTTIVLGGITTNLGVEGTARAASDYDYALEFVADAMTGRAADEHAFAVERTFPNLGTVTTTAAYL